MSGEYFAVCVSRLLLLLGPCGCRRCGLSLCSRLLLLLSLSSLLFLLLSVFAIAMIWRICKPRRKRLPFKQLPRKDGALPTMPRRTNSLFRTGRNTCSFGIPPTLPKFAASRCNASTRICRPRISMNWNFGEIGAYQKIKCDRRNWCRNFTLCFVSFFICICVRAHSVIANVWYKDIILVINPETGMVEKEYGKLLWLSLARTSFCGWFHYEALPLWPCPSIQILLNYIQSIRGRKIGPTC